MDENWPRCKLASVGTKGTLSVRPKSEKLISEVTSHSQPSLPQTSHMLFTIKLCCLKKIAMPLNKASGSKWFKLPEEYTEQASSKAQENQEEADVSGKDTKRELEHFSRDRIFAHAEK